jgi:hypothetical protein
LVLRSQAAVMRCPAAIIPSSHRPTTSDRMEARVISPHVPIPNQGSQPVAHRYGPSLAPHPCNSPTHRFLHSEITNASSLLRPDMAAFCGSSMVSATLSR